MKRVFINILFGIVVIITVTIIEFLITLPFGDPGGTSTDNYASFINRELLLTALPAGIITYLLTWVSRSRNRADGLAKAVIWTIMLALSFVLIGLGNDNFKEIFTCAGIYVLLVCAFLGPIIYSRVKHLAS